MMAVLALLLRMLLRKAGPALAPAPRSEAAEVLPEPVRVLE